MLDANATTEQVLREIIRRFEHGKFWQQGLLTTGGACCLLQMTGRVCRKSWGSDSPQQKATVTRLQRAIGGRIANWNDASGRTWPEVRDMLADAIAGVSRMQDGGWVMR